jgi:hypothetical protein
MVKIKEKEMSKIKYSDSNLYMTTREFADLVVEALNEQNYFKHGEVAHPQDIAFAFSTVGETIGSALYWAIKQEHESNKKNAVMKTGNLRKYALPEDDEIAPLEEKSLGYSEYRHKNAYL